MARDVYVVGSVNVDLVVSAATLPRPGETVAGGTFERHGGGKSANQAVAAARLGANVRMVGAVGDDDLGTEALALLEAEEIDVSGVGRLERSATGVALIVVDAAGENQIAVASGANAELGADAVEAALRGADGGVVLLGFEVPDAPVLAGARAARAAGLEVVVNPAPARALPGELLELSPLLTPNLDEARALAGKDDAEAAARALAARTGAPSSSRWERTARSCSTARRSSGSRRRASRWSTPRGPGTRSTARWPASWRAAPRCPTRSAPRSRSPRLDARTRRADGGPRARRGSSRSMSFPEIYLQDHYAGSTGGLELAKRSAKANAGTEFGGRLHGWWARSTTTGTRSSGSWPAST